MVIFIDGIILFIMIKNVHTDYTNVSVRAGVRGFMGQRGDDILLF